MPEGNTRPRLMVTTTDYHAKKEQDQAAAVSKVPGGEQPPDKMDDAANKSPIDASDSDRRQGSEESGAVAANEHVPAMLQRARKRSQRTLFARFANYWQRPFDGLHQRAWLLANPVLRKFVKSYYRDILIEWREGLNVFVGNEKGGSSKTSVAVLVWLLLAWLLDKTIVLLDFNPAGGHARHRGGVGQTVSMGQFWFDKDFASIESHRALSQQVGTHEVFRNAYLIDWNSEQYKHLKKRLTEEPSVEEIQKVVRGVTNISHTTVIDQGNPLTGAWYLSAPTYRPERSVAVVTFMLDQEFSEDGVSATIDAHKEAEPTCGDRTVLVVMNYKGGRKRRNEQIERLSYSYGIPASRIVVIPHDAAFLNSDEIDPDTGKKLPRVLDPRQLRLRTLAAGMRLLLVIARTSRHYRQLHDNPQLEGK